MHRGIISRLKLAGLNALAVAALVLAACAPQGATGTPGAAGGQTTAQTPVRTPGGQMTPMRTPGAMTPGAAQTPTAMAENIVTLNQRGQSIAVLDPSTLQVTAQIPLSFRPGNMALSPDGRFAWVTQAAMPVGATPGAEETPEGTPGAEMTPEEGTPGAQETPAGTPGAEMTPAETPGAVMTPVGTPGAAQTPGASPAAGTPTVTPAGAAANMVSVIDLTTGQRVDDVQLSSAPGQIVISADGQMVFVGARSGDFVMVVDASQRAEMQQRIALGEQPEGMAFVKAPMAAAQMTPGATPPAQMTPGATPAAQMTPSPMMTPGETPTGMQTPGATPAGTPTAMMTPGATPRAAMTPGAAGATGGVLLVTLPRASAVSVIDPQQLREVARVSVTAPDAQQVMGPTTVFASATGDRIFATGGQMTTVAVLDLTTNQVRMIDLQNVTPVAGASSPRGDLLVVVPRTGNQVLMVDVDAGQVLDQIEVGQNPRSATFTRDGQQVLVANQGDNTLSVIDVSTRTVAQTVQVGEGPVEVALPPPDDVAPAPAGA